MNRFGCGVLAGYAIAGLGFVMLITRGGGGGDEADTEQAAVAPKAPVAVLAPSGLAIPVIGIGRQQLSDTYADARGVRTHGALDIMAPLGTPVVAAMPGIVEKILESDKGGHALYVRSGNWTHYYAHLDHYAPGLSEGQAIKRGQVIGAVGATGNAAPDGPHLHFELKRMQPGEAWYGGRAVNPYPLLAGSPAAR